MQTSYLQRLTLRQVDVFLAVCQHMSYSRAAEELSLTQPAVSAQIRSLEELIRQPLFNYIGRQLYLTAAGKLLLQAARDLQQRLVNLEIELTELHGKLQGSLNIIIESSAEALIPNYINRFCEQHPDAELTLHVDNHQRLIKRLHENLHDLAVITLVPSDQGLDYTPFADHTLVPVVSSKHPLASAGSLDLHTLMQYRLLLREPGSGCRQILEEHCQQHSCVIHKKRVLGSNQSLRHALSDKQSWSVLPTQVAEQGIARGELSQLRVAGFPIRRSWCSAFPRGKRLSPLASAFLDTLHRPA